MTSTPEPTDDGDPADDVAAVSPPESEIDRLVEAISGEDDHVGMAALWRVTMDLEQWWFIAVGEPGQESPAAADIDDQLMLLTFTDGARARHFAVAQGMISSEDELSAIALRPDEVVATSQDYVEAGIDGLMFDPHISGYFISSDQLPVVHAAVRQPAS
ncbi:MAG: hypothetical protein WA892_08830 [Ornithinimicrobium sp.]